MIKTLGHHKAGVGISTYARDGNVLPNGCQGDTVRSEKKKKQTGFD